MWIDWRPSWIFAPGRYQQAAWMLLQKATQTFFLSWFETCASFDNFVSQSQRHVERKIIFFPSPLGIWRQKIWRWKSHLIMLRVGEGPLNTLACVFVARSIFWNRRRANIFLSFLFLVCAKQQRQLSFHSLCQEDFLRILLISEWKDGENIERLKKKHCNNKRNKQRIPRAAIRQKKISQQWSEEKWKKIIFASLRWTKIEDLKNISRYWSRMFDNFNCDN